MEVYVSGAVSVPDSHVDRALVLLRRVGVVVGVLFGFGLIAVVMAGRSSAEERGGATTGSESGLLSGLTRPVGDVVTPLADTIRPVTDVVAEPVARAVAEPVAPVVRAVTEPLAPVVRPLTAAVAPVTEPLLRPVLAAAAPVLDAVAPVTEPLLSPVLQVVAPVTGATGLDGDAVAGDVSRQDVVVPVERVQPAAAVTPSASVASVVSSQIREAWLPGIAPMIVSASSPARSPAAVAPVSPVPQPDTPGSPVQFAVTGGGAAGGFGGAHSADGLVSGSDGVTPLRDTYGRSPPGTITGVAWFAYDDRDHPS
jgi:hypothetical protein